MNNGNFKSVSIIIPTYNRSNVIGITLESLINQTYPKEFYEIIIADNNSTDDTKSVVEKWQSISKVPIKYILEPRQGAHLARNAAAKLSESEVLYYTDDDMISDRNLLVNIMRVFDLNYNVAVAGGKVLPKWEFDPPEWLIKYFNDGTLSLIQKREKLIISSFDLEIYSCHQAILRDVLFRCGGFNPDIVKDKLLGNGETGLNIKISQAGYNFAYVDDAIAYHMIPRSRMTQKYLNLRFGNQGSCDSFTIYRKSENSKAVLLKTIFFSHIPFMFKRLMKSIYKKFRKRDLWRIDRVYFHYYYYRIKFDLRLVINEKWRKFVLKYNYLNE